MSRQRPQVLFFDVNETLLDLAGMRLVVGHALGGREDLLPLWFSTLLHYSLVATVGKAYRSFGDIGTAALQMVAANQGISLSTTKARAVIVESLRTLPPHPEVPAALARLQAAGYQLVALTNSSQAGLAAKFEHAGLTDHFTDLLSVERVNKFKPHPDTYAWAAKHMGVQPDTAFMTAAHGWDVAGALWASWRAAFVQRPGAQPYPLGPEPEFTGADLGQVSDYLLSLVEG
ncbi:MAG: haloacid dehalogenase type II [Bacteroidota bacterium]